MPSDGVISLTTDFGHDDPYVGIMKAVILRRFPAARIVDLTHQVPPFRPEIAGLWLGLSCRWFPAGSLHIAVVDPGVGTDRRITLQASGDHRFLAPDNGLADEIARHVRIRSCRHVDTSRLPAAGVSGTFHGRDIFAPLAAGLAAGELRAEDVGPETRDLVPSTLPQPRTSGGTVAGEILFADHFGNLLTNIPAALVGDAAASARCGGRRFRFVRTYGDASPDEPVALIDSFGLLELACRNADAARTLGLGPGDRVTVSGSG